MGKYIKHNSNYIRTDRHQFLKGGSTIFERDWVTLGSQLHFGPGKTPYYYNGNFLFTTSPTPFYQKKYQNGVNVATWTYDDVENASTIVNNVSFDEYTEDIRSFAYYGSCVELVRSTVEKIIKEFPAMITKKPHTLQFYSEEDDGYVNTNYFEIKNDFGIDLINQVVNDGEDELKFLRLSYGDYLLNDSPIVSYVVIEKPMFMLTDEICYSNRKEKYQKYGGLLSKKNYALRGGTNVTVDGVDGKTYWVNKEMETWQSSHPSATAQEIAAQRTAKEAEFNTKHQTYNNWWSSGGQTLIVSQAITYHNEKCDDDADKCPEGACLAYAGNCYFGYSIASSGGYSSSNTMAKQNFTSVNAHKSSDNATFTLTKNNKTLYVFYYYRTNEIVIKTANTTSDSETYVKKRFTYSGSIPFSKYLYITLYNEITIRKEYIYLQAVSKSQYETYEDNPSSSEKVEYSKWRPNDCPIRYWTEATSFEKECDNEYKWNSSEDNPKWNYIIYSKLASLEGGEERNQELYRVIITNEQGTEVTLYAYILDYELVFMTPYTGQMTIKPKQEIIEDYFNNLEGFEKQLLTRKTNPLYSNQFITPLEYEMGYVYYKRTYTWPSNDYCIDISSNAYVDFINQLVSMAETYDELWTDNLWRRMTHEAIKNYDWTYTRHYDDGDEEANVEGGERMHKVINIIGRVFDDLKRKIDTIKQFNRVTYNGDRNTPNAFLSDKLELMGWDVYSTIPMRKSNEIVEDNEETLISANDDVIEISFLNDNNLTWYYSKNPENVTFADVDIEWMRRLILSSKRLLSTKGTINSIEMLMGMFGYGMMDNTKPFEIWEEYQTVRPISYDTKVYITKNGSYGLILQEDYDKLVGVEKQNYEEYSTFGDLIVRLNLSKTNEMLYDDDVSGIPVGSFVVDNNDYTQTYLIPFYEQDKWYDGDLYFQSKGGWAYNKKTDEGDDEINSSSWTETISYLHVVSQVSDLLNINPTSLTEGDIYYVVNVNDYFDNTETGEPLSHFFVIENAYVPEEFSSWTNLDITGNLYQTNDDDEDTKEYNKKYGEYAAKARYLRDLIPYNIGNNPHVGYGKYDKGKEFFEYMEEPFKYAVDDYHFSYEDKQIAEQVKFTLNEEPFKSGNIGCPIYMTYELKDSNTQINSARYILPSQYDLMEKSEQDKYKVVFKNQEDYDVLDFAIKLYYEKSEKTKVFACGYKTATIDADGGLKNLLYKEYVRNNIIDLMKSKCYLNSKVLHIKNNLNNEHYINYFKNIIIHYLMQIIPSTTILILEDFEYVQPSTNDDDDNNESD